MTRAKRGRGRPRTVDRSEVVQAAMRAWWTHGAAGVSLNEISRRTGLSKSSLYREFGGEDGLMRAALESYRQLSAAPLLALFDPTAPPAGTLAQVARAVTADRGLPDGCLFTKLRLTDAAVGERTAALVQEMVAERLSVLAAWCDAVGATGAGPPVPAHEAARYVDAQLTLALVRRGAGEPAEAVQADTERALGALLRG